MTAAASAILLALILGVPLYLLLRPSTDRAELIGGGFLLGIATSAMLLFVLAIFNVRWNLFWFLICAGACLLIEVALLWRRGPTWQISFPPVHPAAIGIDLITLIVLIGYALFATSAPLPEFDFISNWGLKGRLFWEYGGIDWHYLEAAWDRAFHADYPPLLPLMYDVVAILGGRWEDRWIGLLFAAFGAAVLLLIRSTLRRETDSELLAALATLALASAAVAPWVGLGEGPLVAYGTAGLLLIRQFLRDRTRTALYAGAVLLGFAGLVKNEGISLMIAATAALLVTGEDRQEARRAFLAMWPAFALAASWQVFRAFHRFPTDLAIGAFWPRVLEHLGDPVAFLEAITRYTVGMPWFWVGIATAILLQARIAVRKEAFILLTLAIQFLFYLSAYAASPHLIGWHIKWSWERLVYHLTLPLATVALALILPLVDFRRLSRGGKRGARSEERGARSDTPALIRRSSLLALRSSKTGLKLRQSSGKRTFLVAIPECPFPVSH